MKKDKSEKFSKSQQVEQNRFAKCDLTVEDNQLARTIAFAMNADIDSFWGFRITIG